MSSVPSSALDAPREPAALRGVRPQERFNSYSHAFGAVLAVVGTVALLAVTEGAPALRAISGVYGFGMLFTFVASALYHAHKRAEGEASGWRRLDHIAVFFMIAGTFTPVSYLFLPPAWFYGVMGAQWALVLVGTPFKLLFVQAPRWVAAAIYVAMGWMALVPMPLLVEAMTATELALLAAGGVAYTGGAVVYALKRPDPWPGAIGFHGLFHLAVLAGAAFHYALVLGAVRAAV